MLKLLVRGQESAITEASSTCFTKENYGANTNTTLSVNTPRGVLGGSVASVSSGLPYTAVPGTTALEPVGLFLNDAAGAAFENSPGVASGKVSVVKGQASVEVDVYETRNAADSDDLTYEEGDKLYSSAQGFLSNEDAGTQTEIGLVTKAPTTASPTLGLDMRL